MPALGQTVLYVLRRLDVEEIKARRRQSYAAAMAGPVPGVCDSGSEVREGDTFPAIVVRRSRSLDEPVSLRVLLDGTDDLWAECRTEGTAPGTWHWPGI